MSQTFSRPYLLDLRSSESFIIIVVAIAIFVDVFIYGMVVPIIPNALIDHIGIPQQNAQALVSVLLAMYGGGLLLGSPIIGYFADRAKTPRVPFLLGLLALAMSTALFMLATSYFGLVLARGLQGLSGAAVWVAGLAMVVDTVDEDNVGEAMGYVLMGMTWGTLLGPAVGGVMYERMGYLGAFSVPIAFIFLDAILRFAVIEKGAAKGLHQDLADCSSDSARERAERAPLLTSLPTEVHPDQNQSSKLPEILTLLAQRRLLLALLNAFVCAATFSAFEATLPIFVSDKFHWTSSGAGLIFLVPSIPTFASTVLGKLVDKYGGRIIASMGFALLTPALILLRLVSHNATADVCLLMSVFAVMGFTLTAGNIAAMTEIFEVISSHEKPEVGNTEVSANPIAQGYALLNIAFSSGQLLGPIIGGLIKAHAGWKAMTLALGLITAVTSFLNMAFRGRRYKGKGREIAQEANA